MQGMPSGDWLRNLRKTAGLSQAQLATKAGIGREAVSYWERKPTVDLRGWAPKLMLDALGEDPLRYFANPLRAREYGVLQPTEWERRQLAALEARIAERQAHRRVSCGAKTRKGQPCRNLSQPGRLRCKFHGGMSTGPKTEEGKKTIADAQRRRWAHQRATSLSA
jgi:transcriptional regulator with XRE-family HTH domain